MGDLVKFPGPYGRRRQITRDDPVRRTLTEIEEIEAQLLLEGLLAPSYTPYWAGQKEE